MYPGRVTDNYIISPWFSTRYMLTEKEKKCNSQSTGRSFIFYSFFWDRFLLCSPDLSRTLYVDQTGSELPECWYLIEALATTPGLKINKKIYLFYLCVAVWVSIHHVPADTHGGQKRALYLLELELQVVRASMLPLGTEFKSSLQQQQVFLTTELSLQSP